MATTTVNVNVAAAGATGQVQFNNGGVFAADANFFWDNTNKRLGVGATPNSSVRLDIRAQGALSTDVALRVRNSADTGNILEVNGLGSVWSHGGGFIASNTAFGRQALLNNTTGVNNTAIGSDALRFNTTGVNNTAIGRDALYRNTTGVSNTAFGLQALYNNTTGASNTAFGRQALLNNTTGVNNTAIGSDALRFNTTGLNNTAIGRDALYRNTTGVSNTAFGLQALYNNTTGASNTAFGVNALFNNTTGANNTALSVNAGRYIADGVTANTITNNSVFLGFDTRALADNQTNQIVIGHNAIGAGSNTATLGNTSIVKTILRGTLNAAGLPTSDAGLVAGDIWNNRGVLNIV